MKYNVYNVGGDVIKDNEIYLLKDNKHLKNLVVSSTDLKPSKSTRGHKHEGQEEVYYFVSGTGEMELDHKRFSVAAGDIILIEDGVFHRVHNTNSSQNLYFVCVFQGQRNH